MDGLSAEDLCPLRPGSAALGIGLGPSRCLLRPERGARVPTHHREAEPGVPVLCARGPVCERKGPSPGVVTAITEHLWRGRHCCRPWTCTHSLNPLHSPMDAHSSSPPGRLEPRAGEAK